MDLGGGDYTVLWGASPVGPIGTSYTVNSLAISLEGLDEAPSFTISLLAPDRAELPFGTTGSILGLWDIHMDGELPEGTQASLSIRYDDLLATTMGIDEEDMALFHFIDGQWYDITEGVDTVNHTVWGSWNVLSLFAVGSNIQIRPQDAIPEPASLTLLAVGGLALLRRRRRGF